MIGTVGGLGDETDLGWATSCSFSGAGCAARWNSVCFEKISEKSRGADSDSCFGSLSESLFCWREGVCWPSLVQTFHKNIHIFQERKSVVQECLVGDAWAAARLPREEFTVLGANPARKYSTRQTQERNRLCCIPLGYNSPTKQQQDWVSLLPHTIPQGRSARSNLLVRLLRELRGIWGCRCQGHFPLVFSSHCSTVLNFL